MAVGQVKTVFNRTYVSVNPDPAAGPDTWLLAVPQVIDDGSGGGGGGGGTGREYQFIGVEPVEITERDLLNGDGEVTTSLDFTTLVDITSV